MRRKSAMCSSPQNINLPYWQEAAAGLRDVAKEMGVEVKVEIDGPAFLFAKRGSGRVPESSFLPPRRNNGVGRQPGMFQAPIAAAIASGIPVICLDSDAPDSKRVMFIGTDNFRAGQESGKRIATS